MLDQTTSWKLIARSGKIYTPEDFTCRSCTPEKEEWVSSQNSFGVTIDKCCKDGITWGKLRITDAPEQILDVRYPVVELPFSNDYDLLFGYDLGTIIKNKNLICGEVQNVRLQGVPILALLGSSDGYYFDARRVELRSAGADYFISEDKTTIRIEIAHAYSELLDGIDAAFGKFSGKWFDAAEIYRSWREEHPIFTGLKVNETLKDIDLWLWNRGPIAEVVPPVIELHQKYPELKLALNWYWWHAIPYDTDYPDFWPPREGEENFRAAVKQLTDLGIYVQVYINGVCWDIDGKSWCDEGLESAMMKEDGTVTNTAFNSYNHHRLGYMCGEGKVFRKRMVDLVTTLRSSGLTGQYMDMISHMGTHHCYNPRHKHLPGDVQIMIDGYREMIDEIHAANPGHPITSEACGECFLDKIAGYTVCNSISSEHLGRDNHEVVPVFPAVYHGKTVLFGNYANISGIAPWDVMWPPEDRWQKEEAWHEIYPDQFYIESARNIVFGVQPTVCDYYPPVAHNPEYEEARIYLAESVFFYRKHKDYLLNGKMLSPEGFVCNEIPVDFFGRKIFTKRPDAKTITKIQPAILHSIWQNEVGKKALIMVNYTANEQNWSYNNLSGTVPPRSFKMVELD